MKFTHAKLRTAGAPKFHYGTLEPCQQFLFLTQTNSSPVPPYESKPPRVDSREGTFFIGVLARFPLTQASFSSIGFLTVSTKERSCDLSRGPAP